MAGPRCPPATIADPVGDVEGNSLTKVIMFLFTAAVATDSLQY